MNARRSALLRRADDAARSFDARMREVEIALADSTKRFVVANSDGLWAEERQYLSRFSVSTLALDGEARQQGFRSRRRLRGGRLFRDRAHARDGGARGGRHRA